jgi:hypothetical protein
MFLDRTYAELQTSDSGIQCRGELHFVLLHFLVSENENEMSNVPFGNHRVFRTDMPGIQADWHTPIRKIAAHPHM